MIGKPGRHIPVEQALEHVFGYTIANDITARDRQAVPHPEGGFEYALGPGKNFDTSAPLGPWIVTRDEIPDPQSLEPAHARQRRAPPDQLDREDDLERRGDRRVLLALLHAASRASCSRRARRAAPRGRPTPRSAASRTSATTSRAAATCRSGDVVRVEIEGIGALSNPIVAGGRRERRRSATRRAGTHATGSREEDETVSLLIPDAPTLFLNARLIDGNGGEAGREGRRDGRGQDDHEGRQDGRLRREPERQHARPRPRGQDPHARADRGPLPHLLLGRARAARPRPEAPGRAHDRLRGQERRARASLRLHGRRERRRAAPDRRDDPRHGQRGRHPRVRAWPRRAATSAPRPGCSTGTRRSGSSAWTASRSSPTASTRSARPCARTSTRAPTSSSST